MVEANITGKVLSPSRMAHIVLRTPRYKSMVEFYKSLLGAHVVAETAVMAFLTYDEEHHRIAICAIPGCGDKVRSSAGLDHIAFTFDSLNDFATAYLQRKARGILPVWSVNHGPTTSMYYQDPDGNVIETQVDNFDTVEEATEYMMGPELAENPFGVDFDPEDLVRRLKSGEPEVDIKKRPNIGPRSIDDVPLLHLPPPVVKDSYEPIEGLSNATPAMQKFQAGSVAV
ncbi:Glyoxalase/Bleomycin resistance protein/Dihydroxybiphenyl dioxygenase [Annulohypoxylon truncatum]|uniref:Glyoxalase/Bleomycin resistance protein/Dihydroxybiphenyl dioxygenase n=1 Tax=Annulohypoxylon truncatum TaxID=327061 RepID=UPI0020081F3F|nr:Glyoxalase/Bleomycin resistance protein/Dihydroxybiphenyl dioxygenase [Annulohypoxylon truncatum]KAI1207042.1 Glyoxalase/Bleomycin resistance protein/Dihydroxybiphenyl dioxygenase [Annulohypoxylon truncatum]